MHTKRLVERGRKERKEETYYENSILHQNCQIAKDPSLH